MTENKNPKRRGIALNSPQDARRLIRRIVNRAFVEGQELEYCGRLAQLLGVWAKFWELEKLGDIEARLTALELAQEVGKK